MMMFSRIGSGTICGLSLGIVLLFCIPVRAHDGLHQQIVAVTKKIRKTPRDPALYLKRAELYRLHAEWKNAEADLVRAERLDPSLTIVNLGRGKLWLEAKQLLKARDALDKYLATDPESFEGVVTLARVYAKLKKADDSDRYFTRAIDLAPQDSSEIYYERAEMLSGSGKIEEALRGLDEGIGKLGGIVTLQMAAVGLELKRGRHELAIARLDKLSESMPRKESLLLRRGEILLHAGKPCEAKVSLIASQNGFDSLPPSRKNVRAVRAHITQLQTLLSMPAVKNCPAV